jgi:hypothetical protein
VYKLIVAATLIALVLFSETSLSAVGKVTEQTGPTEIVRNKRSQPSTINAPVEMNDTIVTAKAKAKLTFDDNTTVNISEQSKMIIDDFVYDPNKGSGKLAMKMVQGTARYASGQIAKNSPQNVNIQTPTATVAVRGTDFSMTVDELGRSLVMLLPSCDAKGCVTGAISVSNEAGTVFLDVAFQATLVTSMNTPPQAPVIITIDTANINNLLIVTPPVEVAKEDLENAQQTALDINFLNKDLLKYNELDKNELEKFRALDINFLDVDLLVNLLDVSTAQLAASQEQLANEATLLPKYSSALGITYYFSDDENRVILRKATTHIAEVTVPIDQDVMINITQDGTPVTQQVNKGGTSVINIIQR